MLFICFNIVITFHPINLFRLARKPHHLHPCSRQIPKQIEGIVSEDEIDHIETDWYFISRYHFKLT